MLNSFFKVILRVELIENICLHIKSNFTILQTHYYHKDVSPQVKGKK